MKTLLIALLLPLTSFGAQHTIDVKKSVQSYLKVSKVRADCTMSMFGGGVSQDIGFVFCDCVTQTLYRGYGASTVVDPSSLPNGVLESVQKQCSQAVADILKRAKKEGEQPSPDKAQ